MRSLCSTVRSGLSAYIDGHADAEQARTIDDHLRSCPSCRAEKEALARTRSLIETAGRLKAPSDWVRDAIRASAAARSRSPLLGDRRLRSQAWTLSSLAAAAVVTIVLLSIRLLGSSSAPPAPTIVSQPAATDQQVSKRDAPAAAPRAIAPREIEAPQAGRASSYRLQGSKSSAEPRPDPAKAEAKESALPTMTLSADRGAGLVKIADDAPSPASPAVVRITVAQIRFPRPEAGENEGAAAEKDRNRPPGAPPPPGEPAKSTAVALRTPSALTSTGAAHRAPAPEPRTIRIRVLLDAAFRVLSASAVDDPADSETIEMISRLPGATIDLEGGRPAGAGVPKAAALPSSPPRVKTAPPLSTPPREILLEIEAPPEP